MIRVAAFGFVQGFMFVFGERVGLVAVNAIRDRIIARTRMKADYDWLLQ